MKKNIFIAVTGRANAGKSSLINLLVGEKIAIVSAKPQTTRTKINGILTQNDTQYVFIDTPGMHKAHNRLSEHMVKHIRTSIADVDLAVLVTDVTKKLSQIETELTENFKNNGIPSIVLLNKVDLVKDKTKILNFIEECKKLHDFDEFIPISVKNEINTDKLLEIFGKYAAESDEHFFPDDMITDQSEKVWLSEIVREKLLHRMHDEIPHGIAVEIESFEFSKTNSGKPIADIGVIIICEKMSHKGMIIGKSGENLKRIGTLARIETEDYLDCKVHMTLWVKVKENWRDKESFIVDLGLSSE